MKEERFVMGKKCTFVLAMVLSIYFGVSAAYAGEKLVISAQFDEMPSEIQSDTFVKQLYVEEKRDFDKKISQKKAQSEPVPLYKYRKLAPSADVQKEGIEIIED